MGLAIYKILLLLLAFTTTTKKWQKCTQFSSGSHFLAGVYFAMVLGLLWLYLTVFYKEVTLQETPIASSGKAFRIAFPAVYEQKGFFFLYSNESIKIEINITWRHLKIDIGNTTISITRNGYFALKDTIPKLNVGFDYTYSNLLFTSLYDFGIHVFAQQLDKNLAVYTALPLVHWGLTYVCIVLKLYANVTTLNVGTISYQFQCEEYDDEVANLHSPYHVLHKFMCPLDEAAPLRSYNYYAGRVSAYNYFQATIFQHKQATRIGTSCIDVDAQTFLAADTPLPDKALGKYFYIFGVSELPSEIIFASFFANTTISIFERNETHPKNYILRNKNRKLIFTMLSTTPRRVECDEKIQVFLLLRPLCRNGAFVSGDLSLTVLIPNNMFYNQYFFTTEAFTHLRNYMVILIPRAGLRTLALNNETVETRTTWRKVMGSMTWHLGEIDLDRRVNFVNAFVNFGCYVYGVGTTESYIYVAGYRQFQCQREKHNPDDMLDNDCDGDIDEEVLNSIDDDGNRGIDEDIGTLGKIQPPKVRVVVTTDVTTKTTSSNKPSFSFSKSFRLYYLFGLLLIIPLVPCIYLLGRRLKDNEPPTLSSSQMGTTDDTHSTTPRTFMEGSSKASSYAATEDVSDT